MKDILNERLIPGTVFSPEKMGNVTGVDFLNKVFYISNGIMLSQIKEITGIDKTTLQNWVKRGWVSNPKKKLYDKEQVARILIINMTRETMQLSRVVYLLRYINGDSEEDKIVSEADLYDYVCKTCDMIFDSYSGGLRSIGDIVWEILADYEEKCGGAKKRLAAGVEAISVIYCSTLLKRSADRFVDGIGMNEKRKR